MDEEKDSKNVKTHSRKECVFYIGKFDGEIFYSVFLVYIKNLS